MYAMARLKSERMVYYINNNPMFFHLSLTKKYRIISQIYYKQKSKTFNVSTNN